MDETRQSPEQIFTCCADYCSRRIYLLQKEKILLISLS